MNSETLGLVLRRAKKELLVIVENENAAECEALLLVSHITGKTRAAIFATMQELVNEEQVALLDKLLYERVERRVPLQYLVGTVQFLDLELMVRPPILIPRPETEEIVAWVIAHLQGLHTLPLRILDLCTGSGCIALALAQAFPKAEVIGVDINPEAVVLAGENAIKNKVGNVRFLEGSLFDPLPEGYLCDLLIANPPYIAENKYVGLQPEVKLWEDKRALIADDNGMACYEAILAHAKLYIDKQSILVQQKRFVLIVEIGIDQQEIGALFQAYGFSRWQLFYDMSNNLRWIAAQYE